jgi:hypothetical protein
MAKSFNLRAAVKQILRGKRCEEASRFIAFRSHYLFAVEFCTPARGNEKGGVEQEEGRFRRRWWTPVPQVADLEELNNYLMKCCSQDRLRRIEGRTDSVGGAFNQKQRSLKKRPSEDFDVHEKMACTLDPNGCVRAKSSRYSTPLHHGTRMEVRVDTSYVEVYGAVHMIARHERSYLGSAGVGTLPGCSGAQTRSF